MDEQFFPPSPPVFQHLDWIALALGAIGSLLWAHNGPRAKYAALWWLASSLLWIAFAWAKGLPALGMRDVIGVSTTLYGCWRWMRPAKAPRPRLREASAVP